MSLRDQPDLGDYIRRLRTEAGIDQATLAAHLDLRQPDISKIERGERSVGASELFRIADALNVTMDDLLVVKDEQDVRVAFRSHGATSAGAGAAIDLVEQLAADLDRLRALAP